MGTVEFILKAGIAVIMLIALGGIRTFWRFWRPDDWEHAKCIAREDIRVLVLDVATVLLGLAAIIWYHELARLVIRGHDALQALQPMMPPLLQ